jgi:hypothetical protein
MSTPQHFKGKDALGHVIEAQAQGIISSAEVHGLELPGYLSALGDAARDTAIVLFLAWEGLYFLNTPPETTLIVLALLTCGWLLWKLGRSSWLGWFRLERLHRALEQERWEIEHHRQQERDELRVLYAAKGFEGKLLEDVLDVLMADNERLLKVMIEEEMGMSLGTTEHPLKQGIGAAAGVFFAATVTLGMLALIGVPGVILGALVTIAITSALAAYYSENKIVPATVWNLGIAMLSVGSLYCLLQFALKRAA